ncbi:hypothetical protein ABZW18_12250 [Streptomyces sp. NPDC004647]|uniref:hypothetical protein n=1 Tax=Streptomyces sp. NPDC004647 TaxID=3154671 RepID=UPI0033AC61B5
MNTTASGDTSGVWLASTVWNLLEEKYGQGNVPSVRKLTQHIREANSGATISHGHVHNILSGDATNITDRTREMLARFFGLPPSRFVPANDTASAGGGQQLEESLAFRFSSLQPEELAAIEKALRMVKEQEKGGGG